MRNSRIFRGGFAFLFFVGIFALATLVVMFLWNLLVPSVIGWAAITYWQAAGFMVLTRLLFGGIGKFGQFGRQPKGFFFGNQERDARFNERMKNMSWEERREHIRKHMADFRNGRFDMQEPAPGNTPE